MTIALLALVLAPTGPLSATQDWPRFRGPNGSGTSTATDLPDRLDAEGNAAWRIELAPGFSSPIVVGKRVLCTGVRDETCVTMCFDADTGETLWTAAAPEALHPWSEEYNTPASPTPASDGERVFVLFPTYGMLAYDLQGEELWRRPMDPFDLPHGMSSSPVPVEDMVLLQCDQNMGSHLLALDATTGKTVWDVRRPGVTHNYASPTLDFPEGSSGVVVTNGAFRTIAYALETGEELWWFDGMGWDTTILPVVGGGLTVVGSNGPPMTAFGGSDLTGDWAGAVTDHDENGDGLLTPGEWGDPSMERLWYYFDLDGNGVMDAEEHAHALKRQASRRRLVAIGLDAKGEVTEQDLRWTYEDARGLPGVGSPVLVEGVLFLVKDGGIVTTLRAADGEVLKQERAGGMGEAMASPAAADGKVYLASAAGVLTVLSAAGDFEVLDQSDLGEEVWASPAISHGSVFIRSMEALYCFREDGEDE